MAEPLSIASGIAGLVTLSGAVLAAGYKQTIQQIGSLTLVQQGLLQDCEKTLRNIQSLIRDCVLLSGHRRKNAVNTLLWPLKQKEIIKNQHVYSSNVGARTNCGNEVIRELARNADEIQERKMLDWLSSLDPTVKHTATTLMKQPGTEEWFLKDQTVLDWLDHGKLLWLRSASGTGKTVLISTVINHIIGSPKDQTRSEALAYHYCDFANPPTLDSGIYTGTTI